MQRKTIRVGSGAVSELEIGEGRPLVFLGGPCAIESRDHALKMAELIGKIWQRVGMRWVYEACYDEDCRSSPGSFHGLGLEEGEPV